MCLLNYSCSNTTSNNENISVEYSFNIPEELFPVNTKIFDSADFEGTNFANISGYAEFLDTEFLQGILSGNLSPTQSFSTSDKQGTTKLNKLSGDYGYGIIVLANQTFLMKKITNGDNWQFSIKSYLSLNGTKDSLRISAEQIIFVEGDLTILGELIIEENSSLILRVGKKINIYDNFIAGGENTIISSIFPQTGSNRYLYVKSTGQSTMIDNLIVSGGTTALQIDNSQNTSFINKVRIFNNDIGLYVNSQAITLTNAYYVTNNEGSIIVNASDGEINNNWYVSNDIGFHFEHMKLDISSSMFAGNTIGLLPIFGNSTIRNSTFLDNEFGISVNTDSIKIYENLFEDNQTGIEFNRNYVQQSYIFSNAAPKNNNFVNNKKYHVNVFGLNSASGPLENGTGIHKNQDFSGNYWVDQSEFQIKTKIQDGEDSGITDLLINISPFLISEVSSAGKQ